jgi:hypothetical protein
VYERLSEVAAQPYPDGGKVGKFVLPTVKHLDDMECALLKPIGISMFVIFRTVLLLTLSNIFMTFAWYGHLKTLNNQRWYIAALVSWSIAFFEYLGDFRERPYYVRVGMRR